jgi:nucleotide-binding universal stress UspA family protein
MIVVALDGSDKDERALQVTRALAELTHTDVRLLRIVQQPTDGASLGMALVGLGGAGSVSRAQIERNMRETASRLGLPANVTVEVRDAADVAGELLRRIAEGVDLFVMATRAAGSLSRALFGSVADTVVRGASCPVVVVPPGAQYGPDKRIVIRRALVPVDGSTASASVVRVCREMFRNSIEYVLIQDVAVESLTGSAIAEELSASMPAGFHAIPPRRTHVPTEEARANLDTLASAMRAEGATASVLMTESGSPADAIVAAVRHALVDIIAMSTRGAGGVTRAMLGSVSDAVVRRSDVPVLLVNPRI